MDEIKTLSEIVYALEEYFDGVRIKIICDRMGIEAKTLIRWEKQYSEIAREYIEMKKENERLRRMFLNLSVLHDSLREVLDEKFPK